jgi:hypothetical protein
MEAKARRAEIQGLSTALRFGRDDEDGCGFGGDDKILGHAMEGKSKRRSRSLRDDSQKGKDKRKAAGVASVEMMGGWSVEVS